MANWQLVNFIIIFVFCLFLFLFLANNLPKMSIRMKSFFEHWTPSWKKFIDTMPERENVLKEIIKNDCYVYVLIMELNN